MSPFQAKPDASETCNYSWLPPPAAIAPVPFQDTSWSCLAFCLWNPKPVDQAHLPIEGGKKKTTQRNNIMQSLPPAPLSISTKSIGGKSLATLSQKSPPPNLHGRQSLARGDGHSASFTPCHGHTCCCVCQSGQSPAQTKHLSPYALPQLLPSTSRDLPSPGPNQPGSSEEGFWNQPAFFTPAPVRWFWNQSGWDHQGSPLQPGGPWGAAGEFFGLHSHKVICQSGHQKLLIFCGSSRPLATTHRDTNPNCWIQMTANFCRSPTSTARLEGQWFMDT